jgi:predicted dehydrogenase
VSEPLRTLLVGLGNIGVGYASDPVMAREYRYASHAQVLGAHPRFSWVAAVDPSPEARERARSFGVPHMASSIEELPASCDVDVAVLAGPPGTRLEALDVLPDLRAVVLEKPIGASLDEAAQLVERCAARRLLAQVSFPRRADEQLRKLAASLPELMGAPQAVFGVYGRGLPNNGSHMIDLLRMLVGEIGTAQALAAPRRIASPPGEVDVPCALTLASGAPAALSPLDFSHYRENALDLWGERARVSIVQQGLAVLVHPRRPHRAVSDENEIASDRPTSLESTLGDALYRLYDNLAAALDGSEDLWSPASSALRTAAVVEAVLQSAERGGAVQVDEVLGGVRSHA